MSDSRKWEQVLRRNYPLSGILALLLAVVLSSVHAQPGSTAIMDSEMLLLSKHDRYQTVYDIDVDTSGVVYTAGPMGVQRVSNRDSKTVTTLESFEALYRDFSGCLWTRAIKGGLSRLAGDTLQPYRYSDRLSDFWQYPITDVYMMRDSTLYMGLKRHGYVKVSNKGEVEHKFPGTAEVYGYVIMRLADGKLFHFQTDSGPRDTLLNVYYLEQTGELKWLAETYDIKDPYESCLVDHGDGRWTLSTGGRTILRGRNDEVLQKKKFDHHVIKLFEDSRGILWIGTVDQGIHRCIDGRLDSTEHLLGKTASAVTAEDENGGLWIKSSQQVFYYLPSTEIQHFSKALGQLKSNQVNTMQSDGDRLLLVNNTVGITIIADTAQNVAFPNEFLQDYDRAKMETHVSEACLDSSDNAVWIASFHFIGKWQKQQWTVHSLRHPDWIGDRLIGVHAIGKDSLIICSRTQVMRWSKGKVLSIEDRPQEMRGFQYTAYDGDLFWVGTTDGSIYTWNARTSEWRTISFAEGEKSSSGISQISSSKGVTMAVSSDHDCFVIRDEKAQLLRMADGSPLKIDECVEFHLREGEFWGRSGKSGFPGFYRLRCSDDDVEVDHFYLHDLVFYYSYQLFRLAIVRGRMFIGTTNGIFSAPMDEFRPHGPFAEAFFTEIRANYSKLKDASKHSLDYDQNLIDASFDAINNRIRLPRYRCRLLGFDTNWALPSYPSIQYTNLAPGEYVLELEASLEKGIWGPTRRVELFIATPYWQTWWFRSLIIALALSLLTLTYIVSLRRREQKSQLIIEKLRAEQQALRSQMNPHFIYNALNSAQKHLLLGNTDKYEQFTSQLAKLLRMGLENSRLEFIPLSRELDFIRNYLEIETGRFPERFSYVITLDPELEDELDLVSVTPLLIQPIIENSVKHAYRDKAVEIRVNLSFENDAALRVILTDNGKGIDPNKKGPSVGSSIVASRIDLLKKQGFEASVSVEPLDPKTGTGTKVTLIIPMQ